MTSSSVPTREVTVGMVRLLDDMKRFFHDGDRGAAPRIEAGFEKLTGETPPSWENRFNAVVPSCMEWLGASVARFLTDERRRRLTDAYGCLYVEQEYSPGGDPLEIAGQWADLVDALNRSLEGQCGEIRTEVALDEKQIRAMRKDRENVPEKLNEAIRPGMVKVGTDFAAPIHHLGRVMKLHEDLLRGKEHYLFGHIGNGHVHVNMLPRDRQELKECRALSVALAREICSLGGTVSAEHGIGKLKHELLEIMVGTQGIEDIRKVKRSLDPRNILNRHDMVPDESVLPATSRSS
ncbi:MAG: FAD-linked oxidase C-terminal domain-containing protein [Deltaproteobacteria bacterium]